MASDPLANENFGFCPFVATIQHTTVKIKITKKILHTFNGEFMFFIAREYSQTDQEDNKNQSLSCSPPAGMHVCPCCRPRQLDFMPEHQAEIAEGKYRQE